MSRLLFVASLAACVANLASVPELRPILVEQVEATWFRDGRLLAEIKTKGELSSPSIDVRNKFPDVKAMVRKAGEKLLKGKAEDFLKGVLGD